MKVIQRIILFTILTAVLTGALHAAGGGGHSSDYPKIPMPLEDYHDEEIEGLMGKLVYRIQADPFNLVATLIFVLAIMHTFMASTFLKLAHKWSHEHEAKLKAQGIEDKNNVSFKAEIMHFLGEVEAIFGIWLVPLIISALFMYPWGTITSYFDYLYVNKYAEPIFVVVIMAIASTRPILQFSEMAMKQVANIGKGNVFSWWLTILVVAPLLGSFITEPAAMTIAALLLGKQFYQFRPRAVFAYATLGLLFVNISVGGTLTHFAAPPVLMVAGRWGWDIGFMFMNFGIYAALGIVIATIVYALIFRKDFAKLEETRKAQMVDDEATTPIPAWITVTHLMFMAWTVFTLHHPPMVVGGFLFFLAFTVATQNHQDDVDIKAPLLVGFFLAGLITHGSLQQWWIAPVLSSLGEVPLFIGSATLTAFNDNAAITFLASLVPDFNAGVLAAAGELEKAEIAKNLQHAVVAGAVTGGGLTVIANAPNPAGQSILNKYFTGGITPLGLFLGAFIPTVIIGFCFMAL